MIVQILMLICSERANLFGKRASYFALSQPSATFLPYIYVVQFPNLLTDGVGIWIDALKSGKEPNKKRPFLVVFNYF